MVTKYINQDFMASPLAGKLKGKKRALSLLSLNTHVTPRDYFDSMSDRMRTKHISLLRNEKQASREFEELEAQGLISSVFTSGITQSLEPSLDRFSEVLSGFEQKLNAGLKDAANDIIGKLCFLSLVLAGCYALYNFCSKIGEALFSGLKIALVATGRFGSDLVIKYLEKGVHAQSDFGRENFLIDSASLLIGFLLLDNFDVKGFLKVAMNDKRRDSFSKSVSSLVNMLQYGYQNLRGFLTGDPISYEYSISDAEVSDWVATVRDMKLDLLRGKLLVNRANYESLNSLLVIGMRLKYKYAPAGRELDNVKNVIRLANLDLENILATFSKSSFDKCSIRIKPLTIVLKGKSGVGKSAMTVPLLDNILMRTFKTPSEMMRFKENNMDFIYSRAPETDFWDGYFGQKAVVIDDFMQADELRSNGPLTMEAFELIRASNTYPMLLHKAHLEDKGGSYMMSRIILCSTNNFDLRSELLHENEALTRRFDVCAEIYPKPEYCAGAIAPLAQRRLKHLDEFTVDAYEIHVFINGVATVMSYSEFCDYCVEKYFSLERLGDCYLSTVADMREEVFHDALNELQPQGFPAFGKDYYSKAISDLGLEEKDGVEFFLKSFPGIQALLNKHMVSKRQIRGDKDLVMAVVLCQQFLRDKNFVDHSTVNHVHHYVNKFFQREFGYEPCTEVDDIDVHYYEEKMSPQSDYDNGCTSDHVDTARPFGIKVPDAVLAKTFENCSVNVQDEWDESIKTVNTENVMIESHLDRYKFLLNKVDDARNSVVQLVRNRLASFPMMQYVHIAMSLVVLAGAFWASTAGQKPFVQSYSNIKTIKKDSKPTKNQMKSVIVNMTHQSDETDSRVTNNYMSIARKNMYSLEIDGRHACYSIFVRDRQMLVNKHIWKLILRDQVAFTLVPMVSVIGKTQIGIIRVSPQDYNSFNVVGSDGNVDVVMIQFDERVRQHRDITSCFITQGELKKLGEVTPVYVFVPNRDNGNIELFKTGATTKLVDYDDFKQMHVYAYSVPTKVGDCGSIAIINDKCVGYGKILSFHGAGGRGFGCGVTIPDNYFKEMVECQSDYPELHLGHEVVAKIDKPIYLSRNTKLRPSLLKDWIWESKKLPAALKPVDGVDPYDLAVARYATEDIAVDEKVLLVCVSEYSEWLNKLPSREKKILTFEEAVAGIQGDKYINGIPRKTSAGYPYCLGTFDGKKSFFGSEGDYDFTTEKCQILKDEIQKKLEKIKKNERPDFYYMDTLKDETRSRSKVADLKTRMISCCPLDLSILTRMYFGSFAAFMMDNKIMSGSAVGINPLSSDWSDLASYIGGENARCVAGDFSSFDATQSSAICKAIVDIINDWYADDNGHIREMLWREVYNSRHVHGDKVLQFSHCLPSGHPMTSISNSMFVNIAFRMCWVIHCGLLSSIDRFRENVRLVAYGDDNLGSLSPYCVRIGFDFVAIKGGMATLGLTYTPEDKSEDDYSYKKLSDCTFLKRAFVLEDGIWKAPLDLDTVLELPMWYRNGPDVMGRQIENIDNCLRELAVHGVDVFDTYATMLINCAYQHRDVLKMSFILKPIEYYLEKCYASWVDEESLDWFDFSLQPVSNVPCHDGDVVAQADMSAFDGLRRGTKILPAENEDVRKDNTSQSGSSVTDPNYNAVNSTVESRREVNQATGFLQDAEERLYQPFPLKVMNPAGMEFGMDNIDRRSIVSLLSTPINIRTYTLLNTDTANTTIMQIALPFDSGNKGSGSSSGQGMWEQRLNAFQGFKATAVLDFQVNVNRFAQGRLLCHYIPGQNASATETAAHRFDLTTKSQCPNVQINLNRDTTTQLRVPYVSAWPAYDLTRSGGTLAMNTANGQMGIVYVVIYSPLVGTNSLPLNVWLHFEDVELFNPTYAPQSAYNGHLYEPPNVDPELYRFNDYFVPDAIPDDIVWENQAANVSDKETPNGVFSAPLTTLSKAAGVLAEIPSLSSIAGTAAWFTRAMAKAAMAFGFSKPDTEARLTRVVNQNNAYFANGDGEMSTYKMGLSCSNKLDVLPGFAGNDMDEMNIEYICNRPAYYTSFSWTTAASQGTSLLNFNLGPEALMNNYTVASNSNIYTMSPFSAVASMFANWRADIVLTIKIVKTEFHTGRLAVSFRPGYTNSALATTNQEVFLSREILDIKESDTFIITVPYCALIPYLTRPSITGTINISVFNTLNAPATVSSTIAGIVEVSAKNVQFNGIEKQTFTPVQGNNVNWVPQSDYASREKAIVMPGLRETKPYDASRFTCGELITSVKQLLMRFTQGRYDTSGANSQKCLSILPFTLGGCFELTGTYTYAPFGGDALSFISSWYVLARGSVRIGFANRSSNDVALSMYTGTALNSPSWVYNSGFVNSLSASVPASKGTNGVTDVVTVSQWGLTHSRQSDTTFNNSTRTNSLGEPGTVLMYNTNSTWTSNTLSVYRAAGDDYQLGFLIGVPVCIRDTSVASYI